VADNQDHGVFVEAVAVGVVEEGEIVVGVVAAAVGGTAALAVAAVAIGNREFGIYLFAQTSSSYRVVRVRISCPS